MRVFVPRAELYCRVRIKPADPHPASQSYILDVTRFPSFPLSLYQFQSRKSRRIAAGKCLECAEISAAFLETRQSGIVYPTCSTTSRAPGTRSRPVWEYKKICGGSLDVVECEGKQNNVNAIYCFSLNLNLRVGTKWEFGFTTDCNWSDANDFAE